MDADRWRQIETIYAAAQARSAEERPAVDLTGMTIGRFAIQARLGQGGMAEVYRAYDTRLKRTVAIARRARTITFNSESPFSSQLNERIDIQQGNAVTKVIKAGAAGRFPYDFSCAVCINSDVFAAGPEMVVP